MRYETLQSTVGVSRTTVWGTETRWAAARWWTLEKKQNHCIALKPPTAVINRGYSGQGRAYGGDLVSHVPAWCDEEAPESLQVQHLSTIQHMLLLAIYYCIPFLTL